MKLNIRLHPGSSQEKIEKLTDLSYERRSTYPEVRSIGLWIKEKPIEGKANESLVKSLRKYFKGKEIKIISGLKSRNKIVEIK